ncbi:PREDICTED: pancreatic lipase-related protein 2-like [Nicrophorus vespilloides]|uniref:Pancreatic lipase-related protein 2-like n=1 Tax=Nicrophorus vespilloides TaxID=110193 RepID=A0ABM1MUW4_NICVS|nr:PREDICTED: pancreatic lipase-related protein 2-like [Nicrophorus vespilloides]
MGFAHLLTLLIIVSSSSCYLMQNTFKTSFYWYSQKFNGTLDLFYNSEKFEKNLDTKIIIHGFNENVQMPIYKEMVQKFMAKDNLNVITVDYSYYDWQNNYLKILHAIPHIGFYLGELLGRLKLSRCITLGRVQIIGYSTGAQIAAHAARKANQYTRGAKVGRITALNPTRPGFESILVKDDAKLSANDARIVDILHTDRNLGYAESHGSVDFYPNFGDKIQPGCKLVEEKKIYGVGEKDGWKQVLLYDDYCSLKRSALIYAESIYSDKFIATKCESWERYTAGDCDNNEKIIYGDDMPGNAEGSYYFRTNPQSPYALGK